MTTINPTSGNAPGLPTLSDCHTDAIILHGLAQALGELSGSTTPQALQGCGALMAAIEKMSGKLANDLEGVKL